jgi:hypothetical protein
MKSTTKPNPKLTLRQKKELKKRIDALQGKYRGKGLLKAFPVEKELEKEF